MPQRDLFADFARMRAIARAHQEVFVASHPAMHWAFAVRLTEQRIDIADRIRATLCSSQPAVGDAMQCGAKAGMRVAHVRGQVGSIGPATEIAEIGLAIGQKTAAEQGPVAAIDTSRIGHQNGGYRSFVLNTEAAFQTARHVRHSCLSPAVDTPLFIHANERPSSAR